MVNPVIEISTALSELSDIYHKKRDLYYVLREHSARGLSIVELEQKIEQLNDKIKRIKKQWKEEHEIISKLLDIPENVPYGFVVKSRIANTKRYKLEFIKKRYVVFFERFAYVNDKGKIFSFKPLPAIQTIYKKYPEIYSLKDYIKQPYIEVYDKLSQTEFDSLEETHKTSANLSLAIITKLLINDEIY